MTTPAAITFAETALDTIENVTGRVVVILDEEAKMDPGGRRINRLTRQALKQFSESAAFDKMKDGDVVSLLSPSGLEAEALDVIKLTRRPIPPPHDAPGRPWRNCAVTATFCFWPVAAPRSPIWRWVWRCAAMNLAITRQARIRRAPPP